MMRLFERWRESARERWHERGRMNDTQLGWERDGGGHTGQRCGLMIIMMKLFSLHPLLRADGHNDEAIFSPFSIGEAGRGRHHRSMKS